MSTLQPPPPHQSLKEIQEAIAELLGQTQLHASVLYDTQAVNKVVQAGTHLAMACVLLREVNKGHGQPVSTLQALHSLQTMILLEEKR